MCLELKNYKIRREMEPGLKKAALKEGTLVLLCFSWLVGQVFVGAFLFVSEGDCPVLGMRGGV